MKAAPTIETQFEYRRSFLAGAGRVLWNVIRLPIAAVLILLEPVVGFICGLGLAGNPHFHSVRDFRSWPKIPILKSARNFLEFWRNSFSIPRPTVAPCRRLIDFNSWELDSGVDSPYLACSCSARRSVEPYLICRVAAHIHSLHRSKAQYPHPSSLRSRAAHRSRIRDSPPAPIPGKSRTPRTAFPRL